MALTSTIEYCTDRQVQDVYPNLASHDMKRRIYNWVGPSSSVYTAYNTGLVSVLYYDGVEGAPDASLDTNGDFFYTAGTDKLQFYHDATSPNAMVMEAGDDWVNIKERMRRKASRLIESRLDYRMAREVTKDREGNYPEIIIHATALQSVLLHLKTQDPNHEMIEPYQNDLNEIIEGLSAGRIVLPTAISVDSSKGIIREVDTSLGDLRPVELRGNYSGNGYELLKIKIEDNETGVIGTTKMTVYGKSSTAMKAETLIDSEIITGDFQSLGVGNLYIRWGGDDADAVTWADDEYEIELWGAGLEATITSVTETHCTRL